MFAGIFSCTPSFSPEINKVYLILSYLINIKVALAKWLQRYCFGADYTIIQLPTDGQHAKDYFCV